MLQGRQLRGGGGGGGGGGRETLHFLCNNGFRVGMLEVNNSSFLGALGLRVYSNYSNYSALESGFGLSVKTRC